MKFDVAGVERKLRMVIAAIWRKVMFSSSSSEVGGIEGCFGGGNDSYG